MTEPHGLPGGPGGEGAPEVPGGPWPVTPGGPLRGLVVVDLTRALAGPLATFILGALGARVIKVEDPDGGDISRDNSPYLGPEGLASERRSDNDMSLAVLNRCRGKESITLNLKAAGARGILVDLVRRADVLVENFSAGTTSRLGLDYATVSAANPGLVYCSLSGFGSDAEPGLRAMDTIIQALSGAMMTSGDHEDPPTRIGVPLADAMTPLFSVIGILSALRARELSGRGQHVDVSMLGALTSLVAVEDWEAMRRLGMTLRTGPRLPRLAPFGLFRCADGYVSLVAPQDKLVRSLFEAMGRPDLITDPRYATRDARVRHHAELDRDVEGWSSTRTVETVVGELLARGVPAAPVRGPAEATWDPRVVDRGETLPVLHPELGEIPDLRTAGVPVVFSREQLVTSVPAPRLGQHNDAVYGEWLGYDADKRRRLKDLGVI
jgi:CoA:oxalate CoA-transferase